MDEIFEAMASLAARPHIGHVRRDLAPESLRFWRIYSYQIIYRSEKSPVEIVRVLSGYRDIRVLLEGP